MATVIPIDADVTADAPAYVRAEDKKMLEMEDAFPHNFVKGAWERELNDWNAHCVPNGWMICCCSCVSIAQISVRIGIDSYGAALLKQLAYKFFIWAFLTLELVYCVRLWMDMVGDHYTGDILVPMVVIWGSCAVVVAISIYWTWSLTTLRTRVRERFGIAGTASEDKSAMMWCTPCAIAQMATQVKSYTPGSCDFRAPYMLPAYLP